jgi:protein-tyrosine-phosphatase
MCRTASGLAATRLPAAARAGLAGHRSTPVDLAGIRQADLVLALDRSHRTALVRGAPGARPRVFTLREAAALAEPVARQLQAGGLPAGAPPLPAPPDRLGRLRWWVAELEARRHLEAQQGPPPVPADQDVPDPHVVGAQYHPRAFDFIESSVGVLADSLTSALDFVSSNAGFTLDEA